MDLTNGLIPPNWQWMWLAFAVVLAKTLWSAPWHMLKKPGVLNLLLGASVLVLFYWQVKAGVKPGLNLHLLGATLLTLMFGPWFAMLGLMLALLVATFYNGAWDAFAANGFILGVVPVTVSWLIYRVADSRLTNHLFIYIFVNAFLGAALAIMATGLAATVFLSVAGDYAWHDLSRTYLPYYLLMAWSEALTTGVIVTLMVVYRPQWVATFDDKTYIENR
ncbi:MAG TPA: energy-coupling factor ABC transporter permease [Burkholderiales bacterium]|nr:energy-coupling factor ABC transporter permease [Burkholderiales bacterium]